MRKQNYKLVCWDNFAFPVPEKAKWMTIDRDGSIAVHKKRPQTSHFSSYWFSDIDSEYEVSKLASPPQPGEWDTQIYWIGD